MWVVSIYMYITFSSIRRSTTLNAPVYEYGMVFWLLVSSFFQKYSMAFSAEIFHFLRGLLCCLAWDLYSQGWERWALEDCECPFPPLCTYAVVTCQIGALGHALHRCLQVSPLLGTCFESECSPYYWNVHKHSPNAWPRFKSPQVYLHMNGVIRASNCLQQRKTWRGN